MNKKIVVFLIVFLLIFLFLFSGQGKELKTLEKAYKNNPTEDNLFNLCEVALVDDDYDKIIEYFPLLIHSSNFEALYTANPQDGISLTDFTNIYVDAYIFACYKELTYDDFRKKFIEMFPYFIFEKTSSSDYTIYLQTHFYKTFTIDKKTTKDYVDVLNIIYEDESLAKDLRIEGYDFIMEWYGLIGELESYEMVKQKKELMTNDNKQTQSGDGSGYDKTGDGSMSRSGQSQKPLKITGFTLKLNRIRGLFCDKKSRHRTVTCLKED